MTRYAKKPDTNHGEIRDALRAIPGMRVLDTAAMAGLGCDLMARFQDGPPRLLEIKSGAKKPLTDSERRARDHWGDAWHVVTDVDEALRALGAI